MTDAVDEFLEHHGVLGMHWGHHKGGASSTSSSSPKAAKATPVKAPKPTTEDIHAARSRLSVKAGKLDQKAFATYAATTKKGRVAAQEAYDRAEKKLLNDPDNELASKMTKGEKIASGLSLGVTAAFLAGSIALTVAGKH